ncbi:hypothetical protein JKA74_05055 [Marivirga sp. S37H4]|uniref:Uncharacterized protein n=1 Tax=Marivirga aurantiaca TaxID=2802615 RepID=A0A934WWU9_9BACT|nr:hypothetical protein [Marivirga aurantiaca]MBK6264396.1 hypothetical protein [Marivirga aurantiaca]
MEKLITKKQKRYMMNPFIQFFRFIYLNIKIMRIVAGGHGGTREKEI